MKIKIFKKLSVLFEDKSFFNLLICVLLLVAQIYTFISYSYTNRHSKNSDKSIYRTII
ncbi:hypothetical protein rpr22_0539 [Rickettsia prowazekii str. Rp22]|uniref:Uncharacterized protein n=1 Tax=Rickettsia prowazekii (strain Rp22) TaxID=449216 RepID=D5AXA4_RICPP|nr:hypothetical protein rpr22_0539 [Rickettsia prowazekii str. Rp22]